MTEKTLRASKTSGMIISHGNRAARLIRAFSAYRDFFYSWDVAPGCN
jgi:hypothetical protein